MRHFNPRDWQPVEVGAWFAVPTRELEVRSNQAVTVLVADGSHEAILGTGHHVEGRFGTQVECCVTGPTKAKVYIRKPERPVYVPKGEVYTNPDRGIGESGSLEAVQRQLRLLAQRQRAFMRTLARANNEKANDNDPPGAPARQARSGDVVDDDPDGTASPVDGRDETGEPANQG